MSVEIEPFELNFQQPFTVEVSQTLMIRNKSSNPLAFKVKTTAPKQYCVRPNAGRVEPGSDFSVSVLLQAMKTDPAPGTKCRDKFLVQTAPITPDKEFEPIAAVLDDANKNRQTQEQKIRVHWLSADSHDQPVAATPSKPTLNGDHLDTPEASRTYSSPKGNINASEPPPYTDDGESRDYGDSKSESTFSQAATTITSTAQMTYEELKAKLAQAEAQLVAMKDSSGLRQRNVKAGESEKAPVAQAAQAVKNSVEGVPVQIVALLCVISFLLAYFFF